MSVAAAESTTKKRSKIELDQKPHPALMIAIPVLMVAGVSYLIFSVLASISSVNEPVALGVFALLGLALVIALGFEFVNGFHDTANAVATVIYTRSLSPIFAVVWSGFFNFLGVVVSSGAVAYSIITILPLDAILSVSSPDGHVMIISLLLAAVVWNFGTWWLGLPNSSTHALIGSVLGVAIVHQLLAPGGNAASGVEWKQATDVLKALLFSPVIGFVLSALVLLGMKALIHDKKLYEEPGDQPPPKGIRSLLIFTCTAVSYAHGNNDGQKGMGLLMLILIGAAPTAFALNRTMPDSATPQFMQSTSAAQQALNSQNSATPESPPPLMALDGARKTLSDALKSHKVEGPRVEQAIGVIAGDISKRVQAYGSIRKTPAAETQNMRNDMYMVDEAVEKLTDDSKKAKQVFGESGAKALTDYHKSLDHAVRYIPLWVKIITALALGLGTMVGWKRIVKTVGERIGKEHLTYAIGASAELVAAATILFLGIKGAPVSTTHILSSGVAGGMVANGSGLDRHTVTAIVSAWILTLPAAVTIAGLLYWALHIAFVRG
jgi:PiT family inorganic phosphate transporter